MPLTPDTFNSTLGELRETLSQQGTSVRRMLERAFDALFANDHEAARDAIGLDDEIDRVDVDVEKRAVKLLVLSAHEAVELEEQSLRSVLTLVKVNNELERIADCAVTIAERTIALAGTSSELPPTTRVLTNSVVGIMRDVARAYAVRDHHLARLVLESEGAVAMFRTEILRQAEGAVASGNMSPRLAFDVAELASQCTIIADHATNVAQQVIYEVTGKIVRHREGRWHFDTDGRIVGTES